MLFNYLFLVVQVIPANTWPGMFKSKSMVGNMLRDIYYANYIVRFDDKYRCAKQ